MRQPVLNLDFTDTRQSFGAFCAEECYLRARDLGVLSRDREYKTIRYIHDTQIFNRISAFAEKMKDAAPVGFSCGAFRFGDVADGDADFV